MFKTIFYKDRQGREPVHEYLEWLDGQNTKDARIRRTKIRGLIKALEKNGILLPVGFCKHLSGEIWELRPVKDRVLFAGWENGLFVLLHCFEKKTQKTPKSEIEQAEREFKDFKERWNKNGRN